MTRTDAQRQAAKRWGKRAVIRANEGMSSPERREAATAEREALEARRDAIDAEIDARLKALDWYQALQAERREVRKRLEAVRWDGCYYKFAVGENIGIGFHIYGQGDTWEEAFAKADEYQRRERERYDAARAARA